MSLSSLNSKFNKSKDNFHKKREKSDNRPFPVETNKAGITNLDSEVVISKSLRKWEEAKFSEKNIQQRSYHSSVIYNSSLYIYGGYEINKGIMNDFFSLDLESKECYSWSSLSKNLPNSVFPEPLHRHSAVVYDNKMYLYGGKVNVFENSNKLYSYDFKYNEWCLASPAEQETEEKNEFPWYLDSHNAEIYEKEMIVFGGFIGGNMNIYSRSIIAYDFEQKIWKEYYLQKNTGEISKQNGVRILPKKRANAGMAIYKNFVYIFGGTNGKSKLRDMWKFDLTQRKWFEIPILSSSSPDARSGHSLLSFQDKLILFGGIHDIAHEKDDIFVFSCSEEKWKQIDEDSRRQLNENTRSPGSSPRTIRKKTTIIRDDKDRDSPKLPSKFFSMKNNEKKNGLFKTTIYLKTTKTNNKNSCSPKRRSILYNTSANSILASKSPRELKEERVIKERNMRKMMLLKEFDVSEEVKTELVIHSPTTEAMRNSINAIKIEIKLGQNSQNFNNNKNNNKEIFVNINEKKINLIKGKKPCARDGFSMNLYKEKAVIFGGDRHLMTFHDMFFLNLKMINEEYGENYADA